MRQSLRAVNQKALVLSLLSPLILATSARAEAVQGDKEPSAPPSGQEIAGIEISGYLQSQYEHHEGSRDEVDERDKLLNQDRFLIRRARLKAEREREYSFFMLELDGHTKSGPALRLYRAEAALHYRGERPLSEPPIVKATVGLFDIPFGYELTESSKRRVFMERSRASRAFFPSAPDLGARLSGEIGFFQYAVALQNGEPIGTRFTLEDPNAAKDLSGRLGLRFEGAEGLEVRGGFSGLVGKGFHKGGGVEPSQSFDRWLVGADMGLALTTALGKTQLSAEIQGGMNMDRSADPVALSADRRELGYYVALVQEITPYAVVGFRYDDYAPTYALVRRSPDANLEKARPFRTLSPVLGAVLPGRAKLLFQYDYAIDRPSDAFILRLQVEG